MKCKHCKNEIPDELHFTYCGYCGERLIAERKKKDAVKIPTPVKRGRKWYVDLRREGTVVIEDTEAEAVAKAMAIRAGFIPKQKRITVISVGDCVDEYIADRTNILSPSTIRGYKRIRRTRFTNLMGKGLNTLTPAMLQREINLEIAPNEQGISISPKSVRDAFMLIKAACILKDPNCVTSFEGITLPKPQPAAYAELTIEQISKLMQGLSHSPCELPLLIAIWLGLRRSEILALKKSDFNFASNTVTISSALVENTENKYVEKGTKNASSVRVISCPSIIMEKVKALPDGRIYTHSPDYLRRSLQSLCDELNIPRIRLHDLRHINASIMAITMSERYSMERGGWSNTRTMQGRYQHIFDKEKEAADKRTDEFLQSLLNGVYNNNYNSK